MILYAGGQTGITYITFFLFFILLFLFIIYYNFLHDALLRTLRKHAYSNILKSLQPKKGKISGKKIWYSNSWTTAGQTKNNMSKKVREKSRECHIYKPQPFLQAPIHWLKFYKEAVIESEARTAVEQLKSEA